MNPRTDRALHVLTPPLLAAALGCAGARQSAPTDPPSLLIQDVTVLDVAGDRPPRAHQSILIEGPRIVAVGSPTDIRVPASAQIVNASGKFAIPGLWDMHVHFMNTGPSVLPVYVANGVTSVREMGGYVDSTRAWQKRIAAGTMVGPRFKTPAMIVESPAYLARVRQRDAALGGRLAPRILPYRIGVGDSASAQRAIDSLVALRVDFVKFRSIGSKEAFYALLAAARRAGLTVSGHLPGVVGIGEASDAGQKSLEHAFLPVTAALPDSVRAALYSKLARNGTWYTPTLTVSRSVQIDADSATHLIWGEEGRRADPGWPFASPWLLGWWRMQVDEREAQSDSVHAFNRRVYASSLADVRGLAAAGVRILAGTDAGSVLVYPGFSLHDELRLLVEDAKLTPRQALWAATLGPAIYFGMERELGTIDGGRIADIVLLDGDPLADIRNTTRIAAVIQGGRMFDRGALDHLLQAAKQR